MTDGAKDRRIQAVKLADALNAIEGVPVSKYAKMLSQCWANGDLTGEQMKEALLASHYRLEMCIRDSYFGGTLTANNIEGTQTGIADLSQHDVSEVTDLCAALSILEAPFLFDSEEELFKVTAPDSPIMDRLNEELRDVYKRQPWDRRCRQSRRRPPQLSGLPVLPPLPAPIPDSVRSSSCGI